MLWLSVVAFARCIFGLEFRVSVPSGADFFARIAIFLLTACPFCGLAFAGKGAQSKEDQLPSVVSDALPSCDCRSARSVMAFLELLIGAMIIERLWGLMHKAITHNRCYAAYNEFCEAISVAVIPRPRYQKLQGLTGIFPLRNAVCLCQGRDSDKKTRRNKGK